MVAGQGLLPTLRGAEGHLGTARAGQQPQLYLAVAEVAVPLAELLPADGRYGGLHDQHGAGRDELAGHSEPTPLRGILHLQAV